MRAKPLPFSRATGLTSRTAPPAGGVAKPNYGFPWQPEFRLAKGPRPQRSPLLRLAARQRSARVVREGSASLDLRDARRPLLTSPRDADIDVRRNRFRSRSPPDSRHERLPRHGGAQEQITGFHGNPSFASRRGPARSGPHFCGSPLDPALLVSCGWARPRSISATPGGPSCRRPATRRTSPAHLPPDASS
jgi:hypothetical protein